MAALNKHILLKCVTEARGNQVVILDKFLTCRHNADFIFITVTFDGLE